MKDEGTYIVLYEDPDLLVVDKPVGILTIPGRQGGTDSVLSRLEAERGTKLFVVHRLDSEVSGVLVFAKSAEAHRVLNLQFERREVKKTYASLLLGSTEKNEGTIDAPLRQFGSGRMGVDPRGKESVTRYTVAERLPGHTLVYAQPLTGRRHQLRVHFYSIGHAIAGDLRYGERAVQERYKRLMLHAVRLEITAPSGKPLVVESPLPALFEEVLGEVRAGRVAPISRRDRD